MPAFNGNKVLLTGRIEDISTADAVHIPILDDFDGEVIDVTTVLGGAITVADATITVSKNASSMGTITVAYTSSAEGDIDNLIPTSANRFVVAGDYLKIATDGGSTTARTLSYAVIIKR